MTPETLAERLQKAAYARLSGEEYYSVLAGEALAWVEERLPSVEELAARMTSYFGGTIAAKLPGAANLRALLRERLSQ